MRARVPRSRITQDRWLVSYADFITLLFGFFVVLYAFSKADQKKQYQVTESIDTAFKSLGLFADATRRPAAGADSGPSAGKDQPVLPMNIVMGEDVLAPAKVKDNLDHIRRELQQTLSNQVAQHTVSIQMGRDGLVISLREAGFFASGSATPKPETLGTLRQIGASLGRTGYDLRIEGHTDDAPIHTAEFDSNWELSSARPSPQSNLCRRLRRIPSRRQQLNRGRPRPESPRRPGGPAPQQAQPLRSRISPPFRRMAENHRRRPGSGGRRRSARREPVVRFTGTAASPKCRVPIAFVSFSGPKAGKPTLGTFRESARPARPRRDATCFRSHIHKRTHELRHAVDIETWMRRNIIQRPREGDAAQVTSGHS